MRKKKREDKAKPIYMKSHIYIKELSVARELCKEVIPEK